MVEGARGRSDEASVGGSASAAGGRGEPARAAPRARLRRDPRPRWRLAVALAAALLPTASARPAAAAATDQIAAGRSHTCALREGEVRCWGLNGSGQLGDGTTAWAQPSAVAVRGLTGGAAAIAPGGYHTCALTTDGGAQCWGYNGHGQLGDGTTEDRPLAVAVSGLAAGVAAVAAGESHSCALTREGAVRCWGANRFGQLGDGTTADRATPVDVAGLGEGAKAIAAGTDYTCALTARGAVKCWGRNDSGQLGDGRTTARREPVDVAGAAGTVTAIAVGARHACALTTSGGVKCWGANDSGSLGDGTRADRTGAADVVGLAGGVTAIAAGHDHSCALTAGGEVRCWGRNFAGQLGDGTTVDRTSAVEVRELAGAAAAIAAGEGHTCALFAAGRVRCWGASGLGQLGEGLTASAAKP